MPRRIYPIVGLALLVLLLLTLAAGCGQNYLNRGNRYYHSGDLDRAIAEYDQAIALDPQYAGACYHRGLAYYHKGDLDRAIADLERALDLGLSPDVKQYAEEVLEELRR